MLACEWHAGRNVPSRECITAFQDFLLEELASNQWSFVRLLKHHNVDLTGDTPDWAYLRITHMDHDWRRAFRMVTGKDFPAHEICERRTAIPQHAHKCYGDFYVDLDSYGSGAPNSRLVTRNIEANRLIFKRFRYSTDRRLIL